MFARLVCVRLPIGISLTLVGLVCTLSVVHAEPPASLPEMLDDATLNDVVFLDPDRGWAVGDRGVILATEDGGRHWRLLDSPVTGRLRSIHFVDGQQAWIAGGWTQPYSHLTRGILLQTDDGGRRWIRRAVETLPAIQCATFVDSQRGQAFGASSSLFPSGVYRTSDGGLSWAAIRGERTGGWKAADFSGPDDGLLVGRQAFPLARLTGQRFVPVVLPATMAAGVRQVRGDGQGTTWLVGDRGLVLWSRDGGSSWQTPAAPFPAGLTGRIDFAAIASYGTHVWMAGAPGSCVLHTPDSGRSWEILETGQTAPLTAVHFLDEKRGWAAGTLGTILATRDGGVSWHRQRGTGRIAMLGVFDEGRLTPWEALVRVSGNEGYQTAIEVFPRSNADDTAESLREDRWQEAALLVGASTAWINSPDPVSLRPGDTPAAQAVSAALLDKLIQRIRQWKPDVILVASPPPSQANPPVLRELVLSAVQRAADPAVRDVVPGMSPWKVKKVIGSVSRQEASGLNVQASQLAPRLGRSLADQAFPARCMLLSEPEIPPETLDFRVLANALPGDVARKDFFSGVSLVAGAEGRRTLGPGGGNVDEIARSLQRQRTLRMLEGRWSDQDRENLVGQMVQAAAALPPATAGDTLLALAERYRQKGEWELASELYRLILETHHQHDACDAAAFALLEYLVSAERTHFSQNRRSADVQVASAEAPVGNQRPVVPAAVSRQSGGEPSARLASASSEDRVGWLNRWLSERRPALASEPQIRFLQAAFERRQGRSHDAQLIYAALTNDRYPLSWRNAARAELWLTNPRGRPPRPLETAGRATARPRLDGRLDDLAWTEATELVLRAGADLPSRATTTARIAYDDGFLYVAIEATKIDEVRYLTTVAPRPRDPDQLAEDRVELFLDVDRDYSSCYSLVADHRGWVSESCLGDARWNPKWYVASAADEDSWRVEAAIPLAELIGDQPATGMVWNVGVRRRVPGHAASGWPGTILEENRPQNYGMVSFGNTH